MSDTLTIKKPPAPEGWEIVDCRPPDLGACVITSDGKGICQVGRCYDPGEPRYIVCRVHTDTERLDAVRANCWSVQCCVNGNWWLERPTNICVSGTHIDLRAAIDEAMDQEQS